MQKRPGAFSNVAQTFQELLLIDGCALASVTLVHVPGLTALQPAFPQDAAGSAIAAAVVFEVIQ